MNSSSSAEIKQFLTSLWLLVDSFPEFDCSFESLVGEFRFLIHSRDRRMSSTGKETERKSCSLSPLLRTCDTKAKILRQNWETQSHLAENASVRQPQLWCARTLYPEVRLRWLVAHLKALDQCYSTIPLAFETRS